MRTGDGSTGYLPVDIDCKHYLNIISHVYTANNKMEATVVLIHYNTTHLVQFKDRYLFLEAELYRWMYDGHTTGCNRSKRFLSVRRFQQFQLELSHQKLQAVAQDDIIRWQSICRAYTWSSLFGKQQMLLSDDAYINDLVAGKTATNSVCQDALQHEL